MRSSVRVPRDRQATLERLRGAIDALATAGHPPRPALPTAWPDTDAILFGGGLMYGALHEWFGLAPNLDPPNPDPPVPEPRRAVAPWTPPLAVLVHLAARARLAPTDNPAPPPSTLPRGSPVLWIGRRVWPYGHALTHPRHSLLNASLCVDPHTQDERFWAIDVALRCAGDGAVVIADASGLNIAGSRRLQLAAESGGALALLTRPPWEAAQPSVAATRWRVRSAWGPAFAPRWSIELVRCKGSHAHHSHARPWTVERTSDGRLVSLPPNLVDRSRPAALAS